MDRRRIVKSPTALFCQAGYDIVPGFDMLCCNARQVGKEWYASRYVCVFTIARSDHIEPAVRAAPLDLTPFIINTYVFLEALLQKDQILRTPNNVGQFACFVKTLEHRKP